MLESGVWPTSGLRLAGAIMGLETTADRIASRHFIVPASPSMSMCEARRRVVRLGTETATSDSEPWALGITEPP